MKDDLFRELEASVREAAATLRGEKPPSRTFVVDNPDVKALRGSFRLSQTEFAQLLGISVKTLRNWEQGRRRPDGPARVLLQVAARHPEAVWDAVRPGVKWAGKGPVNGGGGGRESRRRPTYLAAVYRNSFMWTADKNMTLGPELGRR